MKKRIGKVKIKKLSELLSNLNIIIFTPDDINILKGGPENRRKFLDMMIGQLRPNYVFILNNYLTTLKQRNLYLKQIKDENKNPDLLDIWDDKLIEYAYDIYLYRKEFIDKIKNSIKINHKEITNNKEEINIEYLSECGDKKLLKNKLLERRKLDIIKLAELNVVKSEIDDCPILLLDDFMSELDKNRINNFLEKIGDMQVIITCTEKLDIEKNNFFVYNVKDGKVFNENL